LLALAGDNVDVRGSKYQSAELGHLVPLLVDPAGDLIELSNADVLDLLGEVLARMLAITDQATDFGSGLVAEYIGHALDVPAPRLDTAEFLATLHGEELRKVSQAHLRGSVVHTTVVALRNYLVGKLPNWRPAVFGAPGRRQSPRRAAAPQPKQPRVKRYENHYRKHRGNGHAERCPGSDLGGPH